MKLAGQGPLRKVEVEKRQHKRRFKRLKHARTCLVSVDLIDMRWYSYDTTQVDMNASKTHSWAAPTDHLLSLTEASEAMAQEHGLRCAAEGTARSVGCESLAASKSTCKQSGVESK